MNYLDNPSFDNTSRAHPAYFRGKLQGVNDLLFIVRAILVGEDKGDGQNNNPNIEKMRRDILECVRLAELGKRIEEEIKTASAVEKSKKQKAE